jgi:serine/threonine-protein kinase
MGIVYKAHDTELDRIVALKMIKGGLLATDKEVLRFQQEARAIARLNHPNIVPVYENGQEEGRHFFTMAFAWGGNLAEQQGRFVSDPRGAVALVEKIARAVHYAHQRGILHRDLKPANILFDEQGIPWVSDFGLAKFVDASQDLTRAGQLLGTPSHMAPEQAAGQTDQISPQTDVWALGVLLYELLTGRGPFKGGSQEEQLRKVRTAEPPPPRSVNRSLDRGLETVILKCLEKEPARRYSSAEALADDLARWLQGEPVLARRPSWLVRTGRIIRRSRRPAVRLGAVVVLLVLVWLAWKVSALSLPLEKSEDEKRQEVIEEWQARLHRGEKVTLIGESGLPRASQWAPLRSGLMLPLEDSNGLCCLHAGRQESMLELLPDAPNAPKRFRLRAQVQHCDSLDWKGDWDGQVGIYFAHGKHRVDGIETHCFFRLSFNDRTPSEDARIEDLHLLPQVRGDLPPGAGPLSQACLTFVVYHECEGASLTDQILDCPIKRVFIPTGQLKHMPWRCLEVEFTPEQIKTYWEGQLIKSFWTEKRADGAVIAVDGCDPRKLVERATTIARGKLPNAELVLGGGCGLYVHQGMAAFRSVEIEPLPR